MSPIRPISPMRLMLWWKLQLVRTVTLPLAWRPRYLGGADWRAIHWLGVSLELLWKRL